MANKNIVHVVGTGTIGEPLIGLFTDFRKWNISGSRSISDCRRRTTSRLSSTLNRGGKLVVDERHAASSSTRLPRRSAPKRRWRVTVKCRLHPGRQRQQGEVLRSLHGTEGLPGPGSNSPQAYARESTRKCRHQTSDSYRSPRATRTTSQSAEDDATHAGKLSLNAGRLSACGANDVAHEVVPGRASGGRTTIRVRNASCPRCLPPARDAGR